MKKIRYAIILVILSVVLLSSCGAIGFDITHTSSKAEININNVEDGDFAEISTMSVSNGKTVNIESSLNKGKLKIEFCEAIKVSGSDESDEYVAGDILKTIEINPGDNVDVSLDANRYVLQLTAIGQTDGTVQIKTN